MLVSQCPCTECMAKRVSEPTSRRITDSSLAVVPPPTPTPDWHLPDPGEEYVPHWSDPEYKAPVGPSIGTREGRLSETGGPSEAQPSGGLKYDSGKPRMDLLPAYSLEQIALVLGFGAQKYASWNWSKGIAYSRLLGACLRHLFAWARGENTDKESGLSHLAHAGCCILFLIWMSDKRRDKDDRGDS